VSTLAPPPSSGSSASPAPVPAPYQRQGVAQTAPPTYATTPGRRHFLLRRIHSLAGLAFGGYITIHLLVNATGLWPKVYQQNVDKIHTLEPMLPLIELLLIFGPLLIHALYGAYIGKAGVKFNTTKYNYGGNVRYALQRWTAYILLAFIAYHIATLHKWGLALFHVQGYPDFNPKNTAYQSTVGSIKSPYEHQILNIGVMALYLLGIWSAVFHWANGLWTSAIAWGLTTTARAQRRWGHVCLAFGVIMLVIGTTAWVAFTIKGDATLDVDITRTLPDDESEQVHAQASGGRNTDVHVPAGVTPAPKGNSQ
jgi:succinate dehydrogenase / fumarate reductase cytochrome b subunit